MLFPASILKLSEEAVASKLVPSATTVPNVLGKMPPALGATFHATPSYCQVVLASVYVSPLFGLLGKFRAIFFSYYTIIIC